MDIVYRPLELHECEVVRAFLDANGWAARVSDPKRFEMLISNSDRTQIALNNGNIVGFGRALCDGVSNGYLSMVVVAPEFRGKGIGREIVRRLMGDDPQITWVLRSGRDSRTFWEKLGFNASQIAMERTREE